MVVKLTAWWQSQVILHCLAQGGPMIKCAFLKYHASVQWQDVSVDAWIQPCVMFWTGAGGMSDRRLRPSVLQPVSIIL